ncbi:uncharacterized protein LOC121371787 [Gigantopelta aegis]|uniref:uncharacterized protein LOC121371787 n=1 Tax=Gigantopelta aegis TaxID=1735272 RepID=UPI001B887B85|nr:uncharacterized protein LOC121371787 [Gigantopelta aegis]
MDKHLTMKFRAVPQDPTKQTILIEWPNVKEKIDNLCVVICTEESGDAIFMFVSLPSAGDSLDIPLHIDLSSKPFKVYVYGMQGTHCHYLFSVCASAVKNLVTNKTECKESNWRLHMETHNIEHMSFTSTKINKDQFRLLVYHQQVSDFLMLTPVSTDTPVPKVLHDVLVVIKQPADKPLNEMFIKGTASTSSMKLALDTLSPGKVAVRMYVLEKVHLEPGVWIYKKTLSSEEKAVTWPSQTAGAAAAPPAPLRLPDMTKRDLMLLMQKANSFVARDKQMYVLIHLYRNKPPSYFNNILHKCRGIMEKYRKDFNGDPASCINGTIDGLFFSASLDRQTQRPPNFSYFGAQRLHIPVQLILHENTNMYFADFYCHNTCHYVTVVVTEAWSHTDYFCRNKLLILNPYDNPFIVKRYNHFLQKYIVYVTLSVLVEVFYTEDINVLLLMNMYPSNVFFTQVTTRGKGESLLYGIPKNKNCKICSLT